MSEIVRPVRRDELPPYYIIDASGHVLCECDTLGLADALVAALNAPPDAGDVALEVAYSGMLEHANELLDKLHAAEARESALRSEQHTAVVEASVLRRALHAIAYGHHGVSGFGSAQLTAREAIRMPACKAVKRVQALEEIAEASRLLCKSCDPDVLKLLPTWVRLSLLNLQKDVDALRALDGGGV